MERKKGRPRERVGNGRGVGRDKNRPRGKEGCGG